MYNVTELLYENNRKLVLVELLISLKSAWGLQKNV